MFDANQLRDQSQEELKAMYRDVSKEIFTLRNEISMSRKIEKPHVLRQKKRDRARILTVLRQKGGTL